MKVAPGHYVPAGTDRSRVEQRIVEAMCGLPPTAVVTGWGSGRMHGAAFLDGRAGRTMLPVQVLLPAGSHRAARPGVRFVEGRPDEVVLIHGIRCAAIVPAVFDAMRLRRDVRDAVVDLDMVAAARLVTVADVQEHLASRASWRGTPGVPIVREALPLASNRSASPPETRLRLVWQLDAGLPPPLVNVPVYDRRGRFLGIPDLLDLEAGLAVEYDGDDHRDPVRHSDDVDREAGFRGAGLEVTRVTGRDLRRTPELVHRLRTARSRSRFEPASRRRWVIGR